MNPGQPSGDRGNDATERPLSAWNCVVIGTVVLSPRVHSKEVAGLCDARARPPNSSATVIKAVPTCVHVLRGLQTRSSGIGGSFI